MPKKGIRTALQKGEGDTCEKRLEDNSARRQSLQLAHELINLWDLKHALLFLLLTCKEGDNANIDRAIPIFKHFRRQKLRVLRVSFCCKFHPFKVRL